MTKQQIISRIQRYEAMGERGLADVFRLALEHHELTERLIKEGES